MGPAELRGLRHELRANQAELSERLNAALRRSYDKPRISRWENGREPIPDEVAAAVRSFAAARGRPAKAIVLANQKGGVGKTTSALNLAYGLSRLGRRVLLVDMDPQATATASLLSDGALEAYRQQRTTAHVVLAGRDIRDTIIKAGEQLGAGRPAPFDLLASHIELAETDGKREPGFDVVLREALDGSRDGYDFMVVDAPPNLGMLTWMALAAAELAIVPVRTEPYDTMGVGLILGTINKVQRRLNPQLRLFGILPTQYGRRKLVDREVLAYLSAAGKPSMPILDPVPDSAVFGHAAREGRIALEASPQSAATSVYARLASAISEGKNPPVARLDELEEASSGMVGADR